MKKRRAAIACLLLLAFLSILPLHASHARARLETYEVVVKAGEVYQGVRFPAGTRLYLISGNNAVASATLSADFSMNGHLIKSGTALGITADGDLMEISTEDGQKINDLVFTQGEASLSFADGGKLASGHLHRPKEIQGFRLSGNSNVAFYPDGKLERGQLAEEQESGGLILAAQSTISLFPSGRVRQAKLGQESAFDGLKLKGDANPANPGETEFWPNGKLKTGILAATADIQGFPCGPGPVSFFESGRIRTLTLGRDMKITLAPYEGQSPVDKDARASDSLTLNESGTVIGWGGR